MQRFQIPGGGARLPIDLGPSSQVTNLGPGTLSYADSEVEAADGTVASGSSVTLSETRYLWADSNLTVRVVSLVADDLRERMEAVEIANTSQGSSITTHDGRLDTLESSSVDPAAAVRKWFPVPTGGDDAAELISRLAAGEKDIALRRLTYSWNQTLGVVPAGAMLLGAGKRLTVVNKAFNGDLGSLATGAGFAHLTIDGKGATRTGRGFVISGTDGQQHAEHFRLIDCASACLDFAHQAGSQSTWFDGDIWRYDDSGATAHAIVVEDNAAVINAVPRKFIAMESGGKKFISLGGCADLFINGGGYLGNIAFSDNSRGVCINGQRIGGTVTPWVIKGFNHAIDGCDMGMPIQIAAGASAVTVGGGNTYNITPGTPAVTDLSVFTYLNKIAIPRVAYTPTFSSSGTQPTIGNGTVAGIYSREGVQVDFAVSWTLGSTSSMGTGAVDVSLPYTAQAEPRRLVPCSYFDTSAGTYFGGFAEVVPNDPVLRLRFIGAGGLISATAPFTWATGDILRVGGCYSL